MVVYADPSRSSLAGSNGPETGSGDKTLPELLHDLSTQVSAVVHDEFELARAEMADKGQQAGTGAAMWAGAGVVGLLGLGALTAAAVAGLGEVLALWLAAVVVGVLYLMLAGALVLGGRRELGRAAPPVPVEAVEHVKEDVRWVKAHSRRDRC